MHDIKQLEMEWKKYKAKKLKPIFLLIIFIFLILILFFVLNSSKINKSLLTKSIDNIKERTFDTHSNESKILLNNSLRVLDSTKTTKIKNTIEDKINQNDEVLVDLPILSEDDASKEANPRENKKEKVHINILETSSISAYEDVKKRFYQSKDIDDALFLAKSYFKRGDYNKSVFWAYEVNKLDDKMEESLFIFVKSKVKLGNRNEAITLLKNYLKKTHSENAKRLLYKIENNIF